MGDRPALDGAIAPAWEDATRRSQEAFRAILDAMARPGSIAPCGEGLRPPSPMAPAAAAVALCLCDYDTPVWLDADLDNPDVRQFLRFHAGCPTCTAPENAQFAFIADAQNAPALSRFAQGAIDYPDRSATVAIQVRELEAAGPLALSGPGIETTARLGASLPDRFLCEWAANAASFPLGVDVILVAKARLAALPRSVRIGR